MKLPAALGSITCGHGAASSPHEPSAEDRSKTQAARRCLSVQQDFYLRGLQTFLSWRLYGALFALATNVNTDHLF